MTTPLENHRESAGQLKLVAKLVAKLAIEMAGISTELAGKLSRVFAKLLEPANELAAKLSYSTTAPLLESPRELAWRLKLVVGSVVGVATELADVSTKLTVKLAQAVELVELADDLAAELADELASGPTIAAAKQT